MHKTMHKSYGKHYQLKLNLVLIRFLNHQQYHELPITTSHLYLQPGERRHGRGNPKRDVCGAGFGVIFLLVKPCAFLGGRFKRNVDLLKVIVIAFILMAYVVVNHQCRAFCFIYISFIGAKRPPGQRRDFFWF